MKPYNDQDQKPVTPVVVDSVEGNTDVDVDFYDYNYLEFGGQIKHFIIDSTINA
jgi:hypothetical protein